MILFSFRQLLQMGWEVGYATNEKSSDARANQKAAVLDVRQPVRALRQGILYCMTDVSEFIVQWFFCFVFQTGEF